MHCATRNYSICSSNVHEVHYVKALTWDSLSENSLGLPVRARGDDAWEMYEVCHSEIIACVLYVHNLTLRACASNKNTPIKWHVWIDGIDSRSFKSKTYWHFSNHTRGKYQNRSTVSPLCIVGLFLYECYKERQFEVRFCVYYCRIFHVHMSHRKSEMFQVGAVRISRL